MEKLNKVFVVGVLQEVSTRVGKDRNNQDYIAGSFVVKSGENHIEFKFYSGKLTQKGVLSQRYTRYEQLEGMLNQKVSVNGTIDSRAFYKASDGQIIPFNELNAGFVNIAKDADEDKANFEFSGFVRNPLYERRDSKDEVISYEIEVAQANYKEDGLNVVKFTVPNDQKIRAFVHDNYKKGYTIAISGDIIYTVEQNTVTEEVAFGDPIVKTFTNTRKNYLIRGGKEVILGEAAYQADDISNLEKGYATYLDSVEQEAKRENDSGAAISGDTPAKSATVNRLF